MSRTLEQIFTDNPITTNQGTDLMYFVRSPYSPGNDAGMTFSDFAAQFGAPFVPSALTRTNDTNITLTLGGAPATSLLQNVSLTLGWSGLLSIIRGGTGVGSVTTIPTPTAFAGWDINKNLSSNNFISGTTLVTNSGGTTILTVSSAGQYIFNGTTFQTVELPVVSTLAIGQSWKLINESTNALFVISSGSNSVVTMQPLTQTILTFNGVNATDATSWDVQYTSNTIGVQSITGTANQVIASSPTGNITLSLPQNIDTTSSPTFSSLTLSSPLTVPNGGTDNTSFTPYALICGGTTSTGALQSIISLGTSGQVLTSNGAGALPTFQSLPNNGTVNSGLINQLAWYAATGTTISGLATANNGILVTNASGVPSIGNTIGAGITLPSITFNSTTGIVGTTTNDNAASGSVGEFNSNTSVSTSISNNTITNITNFNLDAGDWDVWGEIQFNAAGSTVTTVTACGVSSVSATFGSFLTQLGSTTNAGQGTRMFATTTRFSLASPTTIYLIGYASFSVSTMTTIGTIFARRRR